MIVNTFIVKNCIDPVFLISFWSLTLWNVQKCLIWSQLCFSFKKVGFHGVLASKCSGGVQKDWMLFCWIPRLETSRVFCPPSFSLRALLLSHTRQDFTNQPETAAESDITSNTILLCWLESPHQSSYELISFCVVLFLSGQVWVPLGGAKHVQLGNT